MPLAKLLFLVGQSVTSYCNVEAIDANKCAIWATVFHVRRSSNISAIVEGTRAFFLVVKGSYMIALMERTSGSEGLYALRLANGMW